MDRIIETVLEFAKADERVRWVMLTGSKANPKIPVDAYQDYDIQIGVHDLDSFLVSDHWLDQFGERAIMQKPEAFSMFPPTLGGRFTYLMQFVDGTRLDLMLVPLDKVYPLDLISKVLLDKDDRLDISSASELVYWDTSKNILECMNEFLWLSYYVVKGVKRNQVIYAQDHLSTMRDMLLQVLAWNRGGNPGLSFKYLESDLDDTVREAILKTYYGRDILSNMMILFELMETAASEYEYDRKEFSLVRSQHQETMV